MKHTGILLPLIFMGGVTFSFMSATTKAASFLIAGVEAYQNINVQGRYTMTCTANLGVVTPDCSGGGNPSWMVSLNPAIVGGCINNIVPVKVNDDGKEKELS